MNDTEKWIKEYLQLGCPEERLTLLACNCEYRDPIHANYCFAVGVAKVLKPTEK